jgi:hypothetical protein
VEPLEKGLKYDAGELKPSQNIREMYLLSKERSYLDIRQQRFSPDKCGVSWMYVEHNAKESKTLVEVDSTLYTNFNFQQGGCQRCRRHGCEASRESQRYLVARSVSREIISS